MVEPKACDACGGRSDRFIQQESFKGLLVTLLARWLNIKVRQGFAAMNQTLQTKAEHITQTTTDPYWRSGRVVNGG